MGRRDRLRRFWRDLGDVGNPSQPHDDEARANLGIRPFPPRADLPPPELSGVGVRHVELVSSASLCYRYFSIIAVHGLGGNWLKTWRADDGAIWLRDRLPQLLEEKNIQARVLSYGYDADFIFTNTINDIEIVARDLLNQVHGIRTTDEQKKAPIIFVAHSLGGLVVKAAFNKAWTENIHYQNVVEKAAGCVFLGVPHRGADLARWARNAATIMSALTGLGNKSLVQAISRSSDEWKKVGWDFVFRTANIFIATFFETQLTGGMMVVDQDSARLGLFGERTGGLPRSDHRNICKFGDSADESDRFFVLGNFVVWIAETALERATESPLNVIEELAADEELMQSLALTHPEHQLRVTCALFSAVGLRQIESLVRRYPHLICQVQRKLSSRSLHDELTVSDNFIPEQYSVDTLAPRFLHTGIFRWNMKDNTISYDVWWLKNPRSWRRIRMTTALGRNQFHSALEGRRDMLSQLTQRTRGGIPLLNFFLDYCLADQDLTGWETSINIIPSSTSGSLDVLNLDFLSGSFSIEDESEDVDCDFVRCTQDILAMGCYAYREINIAMEARLSGLASKVRLRGKVYAQKHMPFRGICDNANAQVYFFLEIEAFRKLQGGTRISEFAGVVLDDGQRYIKSFLRAWEPHMVTDLLRQSVKVDKPIPWHIREKWAKQIVEAVSFTHSNQVILGTLHLSHFGVDDDNNIKLVRIKKQPPDLQGGWMPEHKRNSYGWSMADFIPTKESDVFQLGLVLWLLTDFSVAIPACHQTVVENEVFWQRRARPGACPEDIIDLPPCQQHIPLYYQAIIKMCRQELPSNRKGANELLLDFPGRSSSSQNTAHHHQLVHGDTQDSPWIYPPPTDRLADLNIDNVSSSPDTTEPSAYRKICEMLREMIDDLDGDDDSYLSHDQDEDGDADLSNISDQGEDSHLHNDVVEDDDVDEDGGSYLSSDADEDDETPEWLMAFELMFHFLEKCERRGRIPSCVLD